MFAGTSGALSLAYVADGRLIGYSEDHMNAWDYLAGQLLILREASVVKHGQLFFATAGRSWRPRHPYLRSFWSLTAKAIQPQPVLRHPSLNSLEEVGLIACPARS